MDIQALEARKAELDAQVAASNALGLEMTTELAFAWWDAATALRDARDRDARERILRRH